MRCGRFVPTDLRPLYRRVLCDTEFTMTDPHGALPEWDLTSIYPSITSAEYRHDLEALERLVAELETVVATLGGAQAALVSSNYELGRFELGLTRLNEATLAAWKLDSYVAAILDTDVNTPAARSAEAHIHQFLAHLTNHARRLMDWANRYGIDVLTDRSALARDLAYPIGRMVERATKTMSESEESLATELRRYGAIAWSQLRRDVTASMQARWRDGETEQIVSIGDLRMMMSAPDRDVRRAAYEAECAAWSADAIPLAAALNGIKGEASALANRRGWATPLDEALWQFGFNQSALDTLLTATHDTLPDFRRFLRLKARLVGTSSLAWYDLEAPTGTGRAWTFEEAESLVLEAFHGFSPSMGALADRAFGERWIDARPRQGKQGGGLCYWMGDGVSRIKLEFRSSYDGVRTIAHELGHAYHATVLTAARRTAMEIENTPLPTWETASKFCEQLVLHEAVRRTLDTTGDQLAVLDGHLTAVFRSIVEALTVYLFEARIFDRQGAQAMGTEELNALMMEARTETSGDALDPDTPFPWTWAALPNLYLVDAPFYNLPYLIAQLLGIGLYAQYENDRSDVLHAFDEALAMTGAESLSTFVAHFGMESSFEEFWRAGLRTVASDIDRYEALVRQAGEVADPARHGCQNGQSV